jgi:CRISPR-associated protein Csm2
MAGNDNYQGGGGNRPRVQGNQGYGGGGNRQGGFQQQDREEIPRPSKTEYNPKWITSEADAPLVAYAEKAFKFMAKRGLTKSKIRSIYGEIKRIQMSEFENEKSAFILLKPKVAYALGRDPQNAGLQLFKEIFDLSSVNVTNQKSYQNFCNFMEAILAYHKANGGKD